MCHTRVSDCDESSCTGQPFAGILMSRMMRGVAGWIGVALLVLGGACNQEMEPIPASDGGIGLQDASASFPDASAAGDAAPIPDGGADDGGVCDRDAGVGDGGPCDAGDGGVPGDGGAPGDAGRDALGG